MSQDLDGEFEVFLEDPEEKIDVLEPILKVVLRWFPDVDPKAPESPKETAPEDAEPQVSLRFSFKTIILILRQTFLLSGRLPNLLPPPSLNLSRLSLYFLPPQLSRPLQGPQTFDLGPFTVSLQIGAAIATAKNSHLPT